MKGKGGVILHFFDATGYFFGVGGEVLANSLDDRPG